VAAAHLNGFLVADRLAHDLANLFHAGFVHGLADGVANRARLGFPNRLADGVGASAIAGLVDRLADRIADFLRLGFPHRLADRVVDRPIAGLVHRLADRVANLLRLGLPDRPADRVVHGPIAGFVHRPADRVRTLAVARLRDVLDAVDGAGFANGLADRSIARYLLFLVYDLAAGLHDRVALRLLGARFGHLDATAGFLVAAGTEVRGAGRVRIRGDQQHGCRRYAIHRLHCAISLLGKLERVLGSGQTALPIGGCTAPAAPVRVS